MHADWIQSIERQLAEVPPGCLLESPVSQVPRLHRPGPHWAGRGRVETFSLVSRPHPLPSVFPKRDLFSPGMPPWTPAWKSPTAAGAGWAGR